MLACVLSIVAMATAAWGQDAEPNKCCVDKTFMGQVSAVGGTYYPITGNVQFEDSYTFFAYDYYNKVVGAEFHLRLKNGSEQVTRSLLDYNTDTQYITTDNTSCVMTKIGMPMEDPCVPAGARYLGASKVGYGAESMTLWSWEYQIPNTDILYKRAFTSSCVPVISAYYGTVNGTPKNSFQMYSGYNPGISADIAATLKAPVDADKVCTKIDASYVIATEKPVVG